jgi:hypothetical protein
VTQKDVDDASVRSDHLQSAFVNGGSYVHLCRVGRAELEEGITNLIRSEVRARPLDRVLGLPASRNELTVAVQFQPLKIR